MMKPSKKYTKLRSERDTPPKRDVGSSAVTDPLAEVLANSLSPRAKRKPSDNVGKERNFRSSERRDFKREDRPRRDTPRPDGERNFRPSEGRDFKREDRPRRDGERQGERQGERSYRSSEGRDFKRDDNRDRPRRDTPRPGGERQGERSYRSSEGRDFKRDDNRDRPRRDGERQGERQGERSYRSSEGRDFKRDDRPFKENVGDRTRGDRPPRNKKQAYVSATQSMRKFEEQDLSRHWERDKPRQDRPFRSNSRDASSKGQTNSTNADSEVVRLNRYISMSGICSRREADEMIEQGRVKVNGEVVTTLGTKVHTKKDNVEIFGKAVMPEKHVYILLNKPKDHITTMEDEKDRRTVMDLIKGAGTERVFPVGRLDRNTTGILLLTNDGELAKKLTHPSHRIRKIYYVRLNRELDEVDLWKIRNGIMLEDGVASADQIDYVEGGDKREVGIEIHSGKNRVVRRMFEHLGYEVKSLDRVAFGNLSKKGVERGKWRFLTPMEVNNLKML